LLTGPVGRATLTVLIIAAVLAGMIRTSSQDSGRV
jgi:hypothetical protein